MYRARTGVAYTPTCCVQVQHAQESVPLGGELVLEDTYQTELYWGSNREALEDFLIYGVEVWGALEVIEDEVATDEV